MKTYRYAILVGTDIENLAAKVNRAMRGKGWKPQGGVCAVGPEGTIQSRVYQAMIYTEEATTPPTP